MDTNNPTNIIYTPGATIQRNNEEFEKFGFRWRIGRSWGLAHPDHICYADGNVVQVFENEIRLGLEYKPKCFTTDQKTLMWGIGYVSSLQSFKYGTLKVDFILPQGQHLWPAIWVYDCETWPPEIDIVEAWTNDVLKGKRCYRRVWKGIPIPFTNEIMPGLVMGNCAENKTGKSYRKLFRGTCSSLLNTDGGANTCVLDWQPDEMIIMWNGHVIAREKDKEVLKWFNQSKGMQIHLNNYITNQFNASDFTRIAGDETSCLRILDVSHIPYSIG